MRTFSPRVALSMLVLVVACKKRVDGPMPICMAEVASGAAAEAETQDLPTDVWFSIMLQGFDRKTQSLPDPPRNCAGQAVVATHGGGRCATNREVSLKAARPLTEADLVRAPVGPSMSIVWVKALRTTDGQAIGPIALTEWTQRGVAVRALGTLQAREAKAQLRVEAFGSGRTVVVEGETCPANAPTDCRRVVRLLPLHGDRFVDTPLLASDGSCLGPLEFELYDKEQVALDGGKVRTFELTRSLDFEGGQIVVSEQITVKDSDPAQPDMPAQTYRQAEARRPLSSTREGVVTTPSPWEAMLAEHGSVRAEPTPR